jgi:hypothetical protein
MCCIHHLSLDLANEHPKVIDVTNSQHIALATERNTHISLAHVDSWTTVYRKSGAESRALSPADGSLASVQG